MRNYVVLILTIAISFLNESQAQEKKDIELTIAGGPTSIDGALGYSLQNDLSAPFHRYFGLSLNLTYSTAYDGDKNILVTNTQSTQVTMNHQTLLSANISFYFTPVNTTNHYAYLGGGGGANHEVITKSSANTGNYSLENISKNGLGGNVAIGYDYTFEEGIVVGIKGMGIYSSNWITMALIRLGYRL